MATFIGRFTNFIWIALIITIFISSISCIVFGKSAKERLQGGILVIVAILMLIFFIVEEC